MNERTVEYLERATHLLRRDFDVERDERDELERIAFCSPYSRDNYVANHRDDC
jgi:hypothetical protein